MYILRYSFFGQNDKEIQSSSKITVILIASTIFLSQCNAQPRALQSHSPGSRSALTNIPPPVDFTMQKQPPAFRNPPSGRRNATRDVITDVKMYTVGMYPQRDLKARSRVASLARSSLLSSRLLYRSRLSALYVPPSVICAARSRRRKLASWHERSPRL